MSILRRGGLSIDCIDEGKGPPVVLSHSSVSGNRQWKRLIERLRGRYRVLAPNLHGYGKTTAWSEARTMTVEDAVQVLLGVCETLKWSLIGWRIRRGPYVGAFHQQLARFAAAPPR